MDRIVVVAAIVTCLVLGGCTLIVNVDDRDPSATEEDVLRANGGGAGSAGDGDGSGTTGPGVRAADLVEHLTGGAMTGSWETGCIEDGPDRDREYVLTVDTEGDDVLFQLERNENPGCRVDEQIWGDYVVGAATEIDGNAPLGHDLGNAFAVTFSVEGNGLQFYSDEQAQKANDEHLFGKDDWEPGVDVDLIDDVEVGDGALDIGQSLVLFMVLDSQDALRMSRPADELEGADYALISATFARRE